MTNSRPRPLLLVTAGLLLVTASLAAGPQNRGEPIFLMEQSGQAPLCACITFREDATPGVCMDQVLIRTCVQVDRPRHGPGRYYAPTVCVVEERRLCSKGQSCDRSAGLFCEDDGLESVQITVLRRH